MADITARLVWYRLGETCTNMAERYEKFLEWYEQFSWRRVDILDMLFLGWLLAAFIVVGCINLYLRFFGRPRAKGLAGADGAGSGVVGSGGLAGEGEPCQWINSTIAWLYLHYENTPEIVDSWLRALNEAARRQPGDVQVKFERIQAGSLPPKFTRVHTEVGPRDTLTIISAVELSDLAFLVSTVQQSGTNIKVINHDVTIHKLNGNLKIFSQYNNDQIEVNTSFASKPELKLNIKPRNFESQNFDARSLEGVVRDAVGGAVTSFSLSPKGGYPVLSAMPHQEPFEAHQSLMLGSTPRSTALRDRRLLVKVIKANSLGEKQFATAKSKRSRSSKGCSDPYCIVQMDDPPQKHTTSVVKNTVNPFWDEHFLFDLDDNTRQIRFELFDREKPPGEDHLGRAVLPMAELRRTPSSRQIVPLQGRPGGHEGTSGSLTVEFLFMEPAEAQQMGLSTAQIGDSLSPRRRIETQRTLMPGGTVVTTTTTTTEKPRDGRLDASFSENPNKIQKTDSTSNFRSDSSPYSSHSSAYGGAMDTSISGSQADPQGRSLGSPQLMVTRASPNLDKSKTMPHMTQSSPLEDGRSLETTSQASADTREMKKSKSFASAIRKRFSRPKKARSHSADRAGSLRDANLLKPPENATKTTGSEQHKDDLDNVEVPEGTLRKSRSHSFSSSLRRIFKKKKKEGDPASRASSISRASTRGYGESSYDNPSPNLSNRDDPYRQPSPDFSRDPYNSMYSTSVPATSTLYDH